MGDNGKIQELFLIAQKHIRSQDIYHAPQWFQGFRSKNLITQGEEGTLPSDKL